MRVRGDTFQGRTTTLHGNSAEFPNFVEMIAFKYNFNLLLNFYTFLRVYHEYQCGQKNVFGGHHQGESIWKG